MSENKSMLNTISVLGTVQALLMLEQQETHLAEQFLISPAQDGLRKTKHSLLITMMMEVELQQSHGNGRLILLGEDM